MRPAIWSIPNVTHNGLLHITSIRLHSRTEIDRSIDRSVALNGHCSLLVWKDSNTPQSLLRHAGFIISDNKRKQSGSHWQVNGQWASIHTACRVPNLGKLQASLLTCQPTMTHLNPRAWQQILARQDLMVYVCLSTVPHCFCRTEHVGSAITHKNCGRRVVGSRRQIDKSVVSQWSQ
jgi:hypothetical protein